GMGKAEGAIGYGPNRLGEATKGERDHGMTPWSSPSSHRRYATMVPEALVKAVAKAVERLSRPSIEGWGLRVCDDMAAAGEVVDASEHIGCTSETCAHVSHDPAAPMRRWVPRSGRIVELGSDEEPGEITVRWYAHLDSEDVRYIRLDEPRFFHAAAQYVTSVPDWCLAGLAHGAAA